MGNSISEKFQRLGLLLQDDSDLQYLDTQISSQMDAQMKVATHCPPEKETHKCRLPGPNNEIQDKVSAKFHPYSAVNISSSYCPALAFVRVHHNYFVEEDRQKSLDKFFEPTNVWGRIWTLYYFPLPPGCNKRLLLLVPLQEVINFLQEVNTALSCELRIREDDEGRILQFDEPGCPRPEFLGVSKTLVAKDKLVMDKSYKITGSWGDWSRSYEPDVLQSLERRIGAGLGAERRRKGKGNKKKNRNPLERAREWAERLNRLQQYLGLRPRGAGIATQIPHVDVDKPAPWPYPDGPIFFSVDVEWKERNTTHVTEVGISILDTQDLVGPPGLHGTNWLAMIRSYHLRVSEYRFFVNKKYCSGCPESFNYGTSEFVNWEETGKRIDDFFSPPYDGSRVDRSAGLKERKLIYVGHDTRNDLEQLAIAGSQMFKRIRFNGPEAIFEEIIDTALLFCGLRNQTSPTSLSNMMTGLNIWTRNLHNAGNDAQHAMVALASMMLEAAGEHDAAVSEENSLVEPVQQA